MQCEGGGALDDGGVVAGQQVAESMRSSCGAGSGSRPQTATWSKSPAYTPTPNTPSSTTSPLRASTRTMWPPATRRSWCTIAVRMPDSLLGAMN